MASTAPSRSKKKGKQTLHPTKPNENALYCDVCEGWIDCSSGGDGNMQNHEKSKFHKENYDRKNPQLRAGPLDKFRMKRSSNTAPPIATSPLSNTVPLASAMSGPAATSSESSEHMEVILSDDGNLALRLIDSLRSVARALPPDVPIASESDKLAVFVPPVPDPDVADQGEHVVSKLHDVFGYNPPDTEFQALIRRGPLGVEGFCDWLSYFVRFHGLGSGIIAAKAERLIDAMETLGARGGPAADNADRDPNGLSSMQIDDTGVDNEFEHVLLAAPDIQSAAPDVQPAVLDVEPAAPDVPRPALCSGFSVPFREGQSSHTSYPFALHFYKSLPWTYRPIGHGLRLFSDSCISQYSADVPPCDACLALAGNELLVNIIFRICHGALPHTAYEYLSHQQLVELLRRKTSLLDELRFSTLSTGRILATLTCANDRSQRVMRFIAEGKVQRVSTVLANTFKRGYGLVGVMQLLSKAADGVYKAKSYAESEFQKAFVLLKYGGGRTADFAARAFGLPSACTIRRHMPAAVLRASPGMPTVPELSHNLATALSASAQPFATETHGYVLMLDEIAIEKRLRWDPATNMILGACREHSSACELEFCSGEEATALFKAVDAKRVHLASEATVMAIGAFAAAPRLYEARPFGLSGTCKRETATAQEILIKNALAACNEQRESLGRCYCIASDGDAHRRLAMAAITLHSVLPDSSPIHRLLAPLPLMNLRCGKDALTCDMDMKHVAKRMRNTLLRTIGTIIGGVVVTRSVLRAHLCDAGMSGSTADALLDPEDHQDVVLMYRLLAAVVHLPRTPVNADPFSADVRRVLWLIGRAYYYVLSAYTDTAFSLCQQLEYLSAASFLFLQLYRLDQQRFIPSQLYIDIQIMIKNVYFCVAKTKVDNPTGLFWLLLLGTDRLEKDFGITRTTIGNDSNADLYQLSSRLLAIVLLALILSEHPEWDRGPRRLRLPANVLADLTAELDKRIDHINPASWTGDLHVGDIVLLTCWNQGRALAEAALGEAGIRAEFEMMCATSGFDIFCPFGNGVSVLLDCKADAVDDSLTIPTSSDAANPDATPSTDTAAGEAAECPDDLEDEMISEEAEASYRERTVAYAPTVMMDGTEVHKGRLLRVWSAEQVRPGSTDRMSRIIGDSRFRSQKLAPLCEATEEPTLEVDDPIAMLLRCEEHSFLALARVLSLKSGNRALMSVPISSLDDPNIRVIVQVMRISPRTGERDWVWNRSWENRRALLTLTGRQIQVISPSVETVDGSLVFAFSTEELCVLTSELFRRLRSDLHHQPSVKVTPTFPYRTEQGSACFIAQSDAPDGDIEQSRYRCSRCPSALLDVQDMRHIREHMGAHILHDPHFARSTDTCGLCLRTGGACLMFLKKGTGKDCLILDMQKSRCPNLFKRFSLKPAGEPKDNSPCSNAPVICPACDAKISPAAVWRYCLRQHLLDVHGFTESGIEKWRELWEVDEQEQDDMLEIYWRRNKKPRKTKPGKGARKRKLQISAAHSSRKVSNRYQNTVSEPALPALPSTETAPPAGKKQRTSSEDVLETAVLSPAACDGSESEQSAEFSDLDSESSSSDQASVCNASMAESGNEDTDGELRHDVSPADTSVPVHPVQELAAVPGIGNNAPATVPPSILDQEPSEPRRVRPIRQRTKRGQPEEGGVCFCNEPARENDVQCSKKGCETVSFHRLCVGLLPNERVSRWKCPACEGT